MNKCTPRHSRALPLLRATCAIALACSLEAWGAAAGQVDFAVGAVTLTGTTGQARALAKGAEVESGDRIVTADGRAQIRFSDGSYVSLAPNTEFAIRDYRFDGKTDGSEKGFFALVRGAMRTVTGLVGRVNRQAYQIQTPTATIGIRGTGGIIQVLDDGSTLVTGTSGIWTLTNASGTVDVPAGTAAIAGPSGEAPKPSERLPVIPPPQARDRDRALPGLPQYQAGNDLFPVNGIPRRFENLGELLAPSAPPTTPPPANPPPANPPLQDGAGYAVAFAYGAGNAPSSYSQLDSSASTVAKFVNGQAISFSGASSTWELASGTNADYGTDGGVIAWGRWVGGATQSGGTPVTFGSQQGLHYVIGVPATQMPTGTATVPFNLIGATQPTLSDGTQAPGTFSGTVGVNFASGKVGLDFKADFSTWAVKVQTAGGATNPANSGIAIASGTPTFSGLVSGSGVQVAGANPALTCSIAPCSANISGSFFGTGATHAGFGYQITGYPGPAVVGAAAFKR